MTTEEKKLKNKVYEKTVLFSGMCFDTTDEINKAQDFLCLLIKKGIIAFPDET